MSLLLLSLISSDFYACQCLVFRRNVIGAGIEEEDRKHTWMEDAESVSVLAWPFTVLIHRIEYPVRGTCWLSQFTMPPHMQIESIRQSFSNLFIPLTL